MKKLIVLAICGIVAMAGCKSNKAQGTESDADSTLADTVAIAEEEPQDTTPLPMFLFCLDKDYMQMVYWTDIKEPQKDNDNAEYFDEISTPGIKVGNCRISSAAMLPNIRRCMWARVRLRISNISANS